jgi:hypothetical protein
MMATEAEIQQVMKETGMAYMQAYYHLRHRYQLFGKSNIKALRPLTPLERSKL